MKTTRYEGSGKMKIAFIGSVLTDDQIALHPACSVAGNKMQLGFIRSLIRYKKAVTVFSIKPKKQNAIREKAFNKHEERLINNHTPLIQLGYVNLLIIKQITIFISIFLNLSKWVLINKKEKKILIVFNTISYIALPVLFVSKIFGIKKLAIIADLPMVKLQANILHKLEDQIEISIIKKFDYLIPITERIALDYGNNKPYLVVEAGIEEYYINNEKYPEKNGSFDIIFSGTLNELSGIELAIQAMGLLKHTNIILHIYGRGVLEEFVINATKMNTNIIYHGSISNDEMMKKQKQCNLLISPRIPDDYMTKYTFPSKILEYMVSDVPIICNKLSGIPKEYYSYLTALDIPDYRVWATTIENIYNDKSNHYKEIARKAKEYVLMNKTWEKQAEKICSFIDNIQ